MDKLRAMTTFVRIVDKGSLTGAAADLGSSVPSVVRTLADGPHEAGRHALLWEGQDERGVRRGAGVYLLRLESAEGRLTRRLVFIP